MKKKIGIWAVALLMATSILVIPGILGPEEAIGQEEEIIDISTFGELKEIVHEEIGQIENESLRAELMEEVENVFDQMEEEYGATDNTTVEELWPEEAVGQEEIIGNSTFGELKEIVHEEIGQIENESLRAELMEEVENVFDQMEEEYGATDNTTVDELTELAEGIEVDEGASFFQLATLGIGYGGSKGTHIFVPFAWWGYGWGATTIDPPIGPSYDVIGSQFGFAIGLAGIWACSSLQPGWIFGYGYCLFACATPI